MNLIKICVWTSDITSRSYYVKMNSTLGSVVPLAMFIQLSLAATNNHNIIWHETLHHFRHFFLGDIWQLPIERNTTDSTDKRDRTVRTVMTVRTDMRNMIDICARQLLQVLRCYTFCQPSGNPTEWESSGLTGYQASNRQVWLIVAHFTRSPPF